MAEGDCVTFIWKISNLFRNTVESPEFFVHAFRESEWTLRLNVPPSWSDAVTIDLQNLFYKGRRRMYVDLKISILASNPFKTITYEEEDLELPFKTYHRAFGFPTWKTLTKSQREVYFPNGELTIQCKLWCKDDRCSDVIPLFYHAYTRFEVRRLSFQWSLKFEDLLKGQTMEFFVGYNEPIFGIVTVPWENALGFRILQRNIDFDALPLSCKVSVLDANRNVTNWKSWSTQLYVNNIFEFPAFSIADIRRNSKKYLRNNKITLVFDFIYEINDVEDCTYNAVESITTIPPETIPSIQSQSTPSTLPLRAPDVFRSTPNLSAPVKKTSADASTSTDNESDLITQTLKDDLLDMYTTNSWTDVVLEAGGRTFPCQKCILSARSPVFHSLLSESTTYTLRLELKASVLGSMLQFIYTGDIGVSMDFQNATELYEAATKYQIISLKNVCSKFLEDNMTEQNACDLLVLASKLGDATLKTRTEEFILKRPENILASGKWKDLVKNDAKQVVEIMHRMYLGKERGASSSLLLETPIDSTIQDITKKSREEHKSNFWSLFQSSLLSDFEVCTDGGKKFAVHKNILWARSPVFRAMLSSNMRESAMKTLDIPDLDEQTLERLIVFMYTATMEVSEWGEFSKLYYAADKYEILSLKEWCSKCLVQSLSLENAGEVLKVSDRHGDGEFKSDVLDFLSKNSESVVLSPGWKKLMETDPQLASEAMFHIIAKKTNANDANSKVETKKSLTGSEPNKILLESNATTMIEVDFTMLYQEKFLSDCKLSTNDKSFEVHKNILCARSPVLNAMFTSNLEEAATNTLVIPDMDGQTVDQMLRFMYTGACNLEDIESIDLCKLYYAADKYQINSLKDWCSHLLKEKISVENVCEILLLANRHGDTSLETVIKNFLMKNSKEVFNSDLWKAFMLIEPQVSCETMLAIY